VFSLALALACGNTNNNNQNNGAQAGTAGTDAAGGSGDAGETGNASGSGAAGSSAAGSSAGGADAGAGAGGEAPIEPLERVELVRDKVPNKLDLLMMIDNSISMGDKQHLLADAMQHLVNRLVQPRCLDEQGAATGQQATPGGVCPVGSQPEFLPFNDIHAAVVTSSLGGHGASATKDVCATVEGDDHAQLLGIIRPDLPNWNQQGFLAWDPTQMLNPVGITDPALFAAGLAKTVQAAGDHGCGFEASLEGWYRFLVDPEPPLAVVVPVVGGQAEVQGVSAAVLAQRAAFLRSDSVLGIVMLSDENDCSIVDGGYGYLVSRTEKMYRSTSACAADPNDPCCQSCAEAITHDGCPAIATDSECVKGSTLASEDDSLNLRCYHQKQRFGFDLLYPVQRYIDALTVSQIHRRSDNALVANPIYESKNGAPPRSPEQVLLLGIVGVPWQDVSDADSLTAPGLKFLSEDAPLTAERWDIILGDPAANVLPLDPFMVESIDDRTTLGLPLSNPIIPGQTLVAATSQNPQANAINGHEQVNQGKIDLQFACTFALPTPIACDAAAKSANKACDCYDSDAIYNRPLCQPPTGGPPTTNQYYGKAYPGLRELMVLKGVGGHGIVASTCPKSADLQSDSYGYRPAMDALAGRVAKQIGRSCLNRDARADADGRTACSVVTASNAATCSCPAAQGLTPARVGVVGPVLEELESVGYCGPGMSCDSLCLCELTQHSGADLTECQTADQAPEAPGFCYLNAVNGEVHAGKASLAEDCVGAAPRRVRFTGGAPASGSIAVLYCAE
jgi:hypothetical protein